MKTTFAIAGVILLGIIGMGFWQGWFSFSKESNVGVTVDADKFNHDKKAFSKTMGEKATALKEKISGLWKKTEAMKAAEATALKKELEDLNLKHEAIEKQIQDLVDTGHDKYEAAKAALEKSLDAVDAKIKTLVKEMDKPATK